MKVENFYLDFLLLLISAVVDFILLWEKRFVKLLTQIQYGNDDIFLIGLYRTVLLQQLLSSM